MANPHDLAPVIGRVVRDPSGLRVGRVAAVDYGAVGRSEAWYLLRLAGRVSDYRAVPASAVQWAPARSARRRLFPGWSAATHRGATLRLSVDLARVHGSPRCGRSGLRRDDLADYYQQSAARTAGLARTRDDQGPRER